MTTEERLDKQAAYLKETREVLLEQREQIRILQIQVKELQAKKLAVKDLNTDEKLEQWLLAKARTYTLEKDGQQMLDIKAIVAALDNKFTSQKIRSRCRKLDLYL